MNEEREPILEENQNNAVGNENARSIGFSKKLGLYGCGFLILATIIILVILILTGMYVPFVGTEGVGP